MTDDGLVKPAAHPICHPMHQLGEFGPRIAGRRDRFVTPPLIRSLIRLIMTDH